MCGYIYAGENYGNQTKSGTVAHNVEKRRRTSELLGSDIRRTSAAGKRENCCELWKEKVDQEVGLPLKGWQPFGK